MIGPAAFATLSNHRTVKPMHQWPNVNRGWLLSLTMTLWAGGLALGQPAAGDQAARAPARDARPNILYIMADDHATHAIGAYGSVINTTPNIDRLAREGMRFTNCFCENSLCTPSRAAILTGTFGCRNGVLVLSDRLDPSKATFPRLLSAAGYQTAIVGKWHLKRQPGEFDHWDVLPDQGVYHDPVFLTPGKRSKIPGYVTDIITDKCIDWLEQRDPTRPFLLMCHHKAPHRPWQPDEKHARMYENVDIPEPATFDDDHATRCDAARRQKMAIEDLTRTDVKADPPEGLTPAQLRHWKYERFIKDYLRCVASMDDNIGRLLEYLDTHDLAKDTIVIYTSDQGFYLGDHGWFDKRWMYEESLRMPLIVRYPAHIKAGSTCDRFVQNVDFAQTMLDFGGATAPGEMQGASFRPLLEGREGPWDRPAVFYHYYEEGTEHHVAAHYGVRTDRYKLIRFYSEVRAWELYDLREDPRELRNVYDDPAYAPIVADLKARLERLKARYGDTTESPRQAPADAPAVPAGTK
ncbi:MAG TPA: sulfatase [Phycisphaerales bacterium]|nr:sulfatase [Phycisphaerales bacterium]